MCISKAINLKNRKYLSFILPYAVLFCMVQLGLMSLLVIYSMQQQLSFSYRQGARAFYCLEKASSSLMKGLIQAKGSSAVYQYMRQNPFYFWDLTGDGVYDAVTVYSMLNLKTNEIEWVAIHYLLKEKIDTITAFPLFETRIAPTSSRRVKMIPHSYVRDAKAVYQYSYFISSCEMKVQKISIPSNEND